MTKIIEINSRKLIKALVAGSAIPKGLFVKRVFITVPGGGDWSNCDLYVDALDGAILKIEVETPGTKAKYE